MQNRREWLLFLVLLGAILFLGVLITLLVVWCMARRRSNQIQREKELKFHGLRGNPALVEALQQSFLFQTATAANIPWGGNEDCLTCALIQMGSSMTYSDNSCPQCGKIYD